MTNEELREMLNAMDLQMEEKPMLVYVFYVRPDGVVRNFSMHISQGRKLSDAAIEDVMRREYPESRMGRVMAVERPHEVGREEQWMDVVEVCEMLKISKRTLSRWTTKGLFTKSQMEGKIYYNRKEIERVLADNVVQENGRIDTSAKGLVGRPSEDKESQ